MSLRDTNDMHGLKKSKRRFVAHCGKKSRSVVIFIMMKQGQLYVTER